MSKIEITSDDFNYELHIKCIAIICEISSGDEQEDFLEHLKKWKV